MPQSNSLLSNLNGMANPACTRTHCMLHGTWVGCKLVCAEEQMCTLTVLCALWLLTKAVRQFVCVTYHYMWVPYKRVCGLLKRTKNEPASSEPSVLVKCRWLPHHTVCQGPTSKLLMNACVWCYCIPEAVRQRGPVHCFMGVPACLVVEWVKVLCLCVWQWWTPVESRSENEGETLVGLPGNGFACVFT